MKRLLVALGVSLALALTPLHTAFAHELLTDSTGAQHAVLHIDPDDDPVAGKPQTLLFTTQNLSGTTALTVDGPNGTSHVLLRTSGAEATTPYTFPSSGTYTLTFTVTSDHGVYTFRHTQQVGDAPQAAAAAHNNWTTPVIITAIIAITIVAVIIKRRYDTTKSAHQSHAD